jgi:hypothetical protein
MELFLSRPSHQYVWKDGTEKLRDIILGDPDDGIEIEPISVFRRPLAILIAAKIDGVVLSRYGHPDPSPPYSQDDSFNPLFIAKCKNQMHFRRLLRV